MVELADTQVSEACGSNPLGVQVPLSAFFLQLGILRSLIMKKKKESAPETKPAKSSFEVVSENRKAYFDYFIHDKYEAGVSLLGHEVKSIRERRINLKDSYVRIFREEAFLLNCHISPYSRIQGHEALDPIRTRKLLLKRSEINRLMGQVGRKGVTIVPLRMYFKKGFVKVEIGIGEGKKQYDKRAAIKERIHTRETQSAIKKATRH